MFVDLDWPLNASSLLSASAELLVCIKVLNCFIHSHGSARMLQERRRKSIGKLEIQPLATPKPLNRSSRNAAYMIWSRMSTNVQNLVTISQGVSFPRIREIFVKDVYSASFFPGCSNGQQPRHLNRLSRVIRHYIIVRNGRGWMSSATTCTKIDWWHFEVYVW